MKIKIKNFNGELPSYLTVGRVYKVEYETTSNCLAIRNNAGPISIVRISDCSHLNGGSWEVVENG